MEIRGRKNKQKSIEYGNITNINHPAYKTYICQGLGFKLIGIRLKTGPGNWWIDGIQFKMIVIPNPSIKRRPRSIKRRPRSIKRRPISIPVRNEYFDVNYSGR
eukprot:455236_1